MGPTKEQKLFMYGQRSLEKYEEIAQTRELTREELDKIDNIKQILLNAVIRFGMAEAHKRMQRYRLDRDAYQDVYQSLAVIFFEHLPDYDPTRSTPTTFFVRYFDQVISEYLHSHSQKRTSYDAHNIAIVRAAIREFETQGTEWNDEMIATRTGLSLKVVRRTRQLAFNSIQADVDKQPIVDTMNMTPEEMFLSQEKERTVASALKNNLSPEEITFFLYKANPEGKYERSIKDTAEHFDIPQREAKKLWSSIIARLQNVRELQQYRHESAEIDVSVALHDMNEEEVKDLLESISEAFSVVKKGNISM